MIKTLDKKILKNKKYIANSKFTIKKILQKFNIQTNKIIFILKGKKLVGSITDGDIRRGFTKGYSINDNLSKFYNNLPLFLEVGKNNFKEKLLIAKKKNIKEIPIVSKNKNYLGFVKLDGLIKNNEILSNNFDIIIMAGGFGKRLLPITKKIPKPLIKVGKDPIIDNLIKKCRLSNVNKIYIVLHYKANLIKKHLLRNFSDLKHKLKFIIEKTPLDTAGGLKLIDIKRSSQQFLLINSDIVTNINFDSLYNFFRENKADLVVCATRNEIVIPYGILDINNKKIKNIQEKPTFNININSGIYFLNQKIIELIKKNEKISAVELIKRSIKKRKKVLNYPVYENWIDIGNHSDLIKAKNF